MVSLGMVGSLFRHLLDNGGEIATAAPFQNMENPSVSIDVSVVVIIVQCGRDEGP